MITLRSTLYHINTIHFVHILPPPPPMPPHFLCALRGPPSWAWQKCKRLLRLGRPWGAGAANVSTRISTQVKNVQNATSVQAPYREGAYLKRHMRSSSELQGSQSAFSHFAHIQYILWKWSAEYETGHLVSWQTFAISPAGYLVTPLSLHTVLVLYFHSTGRI